MPLGYKIAESDPQDLKTVPQCCEQPAKISRIYGILALAAVGIGALVVGLKADASTYEMKSNRENSVRVDVQPVLLKPGQPAKFEVRMNTHSENLGEDMVAVSSLKDNAGRLYQATSWRGSGPGGHHRKGVLEFPHLEENTASVTLVLKGIASVPERNFEWTVER